ncbi:hypothetical protein [Sphingomonas jatrophae]|uniref:Uncharacterized protein n=1 Tax=Sphingomonas jatrophae TaxID=1166337 RepID=A0A1I6JM77_9SPHN|nr:hypothetical protein [Sphingomonas jatrophae]SFR79670.1 hypothetical protein SAMN05192580_0432 [Sphingomonas jatrophae]
MKHEPILPGLKPAMMPWDFIRLRREAAGVSIPELARRLDDVPEHRADVERNLRIWESPGVRLKLYLLETVNRRGFPIDIEIYRQLCEDPVDHHPTLCTGCACSVWTPCTTRDGAECRHEEDGTCTACKEKAERRTTRRAA